MKLTQIQPQTVKILQQKIKSGKKRLLLNANHCKIIVNGDHDKGPNREKNSVMQPSRNRLTSENFPLCKIVKNFLREKNFGNSIPQLLAQSYKTKLYPGKSS